MARPHCFTVLLSIVFPLLLAAGTAFAFPPVETFDEVTIPNLPPRWLYLSALPNNPGPGWITVTDAFSSPNAAFVADQPVVTDQSLTTPLFQIFSANGRVTFQHKFDLESNPPVAEAYDGVALEIAYGNQAFVDITAAGGSFESGGYNGTTPGTFGNPLAGRSVWTGTSQGYQGVVVNLPPTANGQLIKLRWRLGTDNSAALTGYWLDDIRVYGASAPTFPSDETFNELTAPELPLNWINRLASGPGPGWVTAAGSNGTNVAFTDDPPTVSDKSLETPPFDIVANGRVSFIHKLGLESDGETAFDGVVLEIAYGDGPFVDISEAGGVFVFGGYDHVVNTGANPLSGRAAWSGSSVSYLPVVIDLPTAANGRSVRLRWRVGTDNSAGRTGYELDMIHVEVNGAPAFPPDETFDEITGSALPTGWANANGGVGDGWIIVASEAFSAPNAAFTDDPSTPVDRSLTTPVFIGGTNEQLSFRHNVDLDASPGSAVTFDGVVLEISISGAPFQDIVAAGGSFASGGYDHVVFAAVDNPLSGRNAWGGSSGGYQNVVVNLPAAVVNSAVAIRWRMGTDAFVGGRGYFLDDVHLGVPITDRIFSNDFECSAQACD